MSTTSEIIFEIGLKIRRLVKGRIVWEKVQTYANTSMGASVGKDAYTITATCASSSADTLRYNATQ